MKQSNKTILEAIHAAIESHYDDEITIDETLNFIVNASQDIILPPSVDDDA